MTLFYTLANYFCIELKNNKDYEKFKTKTKCKTGVDNEKKKKV